MNTRHLAQLAAPILALLLFTSPATADVDSHHVNPLWVFSLIPDSKIQASYVATTLLPQLVGSDDKLRDRLGFSALSQVSQLVLPDPPFAVFLVGLSRIKDFDPANPFKLFLDRANWFQQSPSSAVPARYLFPIREFTRPPAGCALPSLVDFPLLGCVASSVQVKLLPNRWDFQQIGRPGLIKRLNQYGNGISHFVVWIPVLNLHYLARYEWPGSSPPELKIKAITVDRYVTNPDTGKPLGPGEEVSLVAVFNRLKEVALLIPADGPPG